MQDGALIPRFGRARRDPTLAVLEGFHPLKHALRFGAELLEVACRDTSELDRLAQTLAPDVRAQMLALARSVAPSTFARLAPVEPTTGVIALARRPLVDPAVIFAGQDPAPAVLLEDPRDLGNLGACVRVAAAAAATAVFTTGGHDPWHPDALRGAAGLHFALPVCRLGPPDPLAVLDAVDRPLLALDPEGEELEPARLPPRALLAFGSERAGVSEALMRRAGARVSIPMRPGVSSLNLATSVAAVLFAWRLSAAGRRPAIAAQQD